MQHRIISISIFIQSASKKQTNKTKIPEYWAPASWEQHMLLFFNNAGIVSWIVMFILSNFSALVTAKNYTHVPGCWGGKKKRNHPLCGTLVRLLINLPFGTGHYVFADLRPFCTKCSSHSGFFFLSFFQPVWLAEHQVSPVRWNCRVHARLAHSRPHTNNSKNCKW